LKKLVLFLVLSTSFNSCNKPVTTGQNNATRCGKCFDKIDSTLCGAYLERWFYDETLQKCLKKGYSGCNDIGCKTEQECIDCKDGKSSCLKNGRVLRFNFEKCNCCWGFVLKVNNDTFVVNDQKIFDLIDYTNITSPIEVEVELGTKPNECAETVLFGLKPIAIKQIKIK
jgi:hypothetical protein